MADAYLSSRPPAVIAGAIGPTVSLTQSLGRAGVPVIVLSPGLPTLARASRYCRRVVDVGSSPGVIERWLEWLERDGPDGAVILPSGDEGLELIVRHRDRLLSRGFRLPETAGEVSLAMLDKARSYELGRAGGVPCPRTRTVSTLADLQGVSDELDFPCALKPLHSHLFAKHFPGVKLLIVADEGELVAALEQTTAFGLEMLVTEIIPGTDSCTWSYTTHIDEHGEPLYALTRNKLRSHPIHFGTNSYVVTRRNPEVAAMGLKFLRSVGLRGMAHVEFKWDVRDGQLKLIECNHRFVAVTELFRRAGLDVALFTYCRALGIAPPPMDNWREGTRLWFPDRDTRAAQEYRAAGELTYRQWIRSLAHGRLYTPFFAWDDPGPSVAHWWPKVRRGSGHALGRLVPSLTADRPRN